MQEVIYLKGQLLLLIHFTRPAIPYCRYLLLLAPLRPKPYRDRPPGIKIVQIYREQLHCQGCASQKDSVVSIGQHLPTLKHEYEINHSRLENSLYATSVYNYIRRAMLCIVIV
eukprot:573833-Pleurochrysis_carterae.AAC.2